MRPKDTIIKILSRFLKGLLTYIAMNTASHPTKYVKFDSESLRAKLIRSLQEEINYCESI